MISYRVMVGIALMMSSFLIANARAADWGVCVLYFDITNDNPPEIFASCYEKISRKQCEEYEIGDKIYVPSLKKTFPIANISRNFVLKTCKSFFGGDPDGTWALIATLPDNALKAELTENSQRVQLDLTTLTEEDISGLSIYRAIRLGSGKLQQPVEICSWSAKGSSVSGFAYSCVDGNAPSETLLYWPVDIGNDGIDTHHVDKGIEVNLKE